MLFCFALNPNLGAEGVRKKITPTHRATGDPIADGWDKKVVHGTTGERSEVVGQVIEGILEAVVGTKGAGMVVKDVTSAGKFVLGAERIAVTTEAIAKLQKAMKLEALAGKVAGIFKLGRTKDWQTSVASRPRER
ncbi:hypothetical protein ABIB40_003655 [Pedobacter sp. UYP30]|uniref:hypothetical protein n=1 Tax=Pedobacter sp. UYP30 TaxID=1756400 RepID=UPI003391CDE5